MKLLETTHVHKFDKLATQSNSVWDYREVTTDNPEPILAAVDKIKQVVCDCGAMQALDLERSKA